MTKFSKNVFLSKKWCDHHLQQIKQLAGPRYAPLLNVELPISKIFDGISRTKSFYGEIREQYGKLNRCIQNILRDLNRASINKDEFSEFEKQSKILVGRLSEIKEFNVKRINWGIIHNQTLKLLDLCIKLLSIATAKKTQAASKDDKEKIDFLSHSIFDAQKILYFFESYSEGVKAKLSNDPFLILLGEAGSGKTHLLCDLISSRFGADGTILPAVMVLGEQVDCVADIIPQAIRRFGLKTPKMSEDKFWQSLNDAGKQAGCKALFILDAANEMLHLKSGKKLIASLHEKVCRYKYIAIVVSIRNGFESLFLRETKNNKFIITRHHGFKDVEWRAITIFFSLFKIRLPEVPLLTPEFQNPLFLHLFCKAFQRQVRNHSRKRKKMIYRGHEGATYIFEQFVKSVADRLAVKYKLPPGRSGGQYVIWDTIIEKIACKMAEGDVDRVAELEVVKIIRDSHPNRNHMKLLKDLETNMLLTKIPEFNVSTGEILGFKYR